jgi:hypothetical protein
VHERDVDCARAQPLQAVLEAAPHAGAGIVEALHERQHVHVAVLLVRRAFARQKQAAHLGREHDVVARDVAHRAADAMLGQPLP